MTFYIQYNLIINSDWKGYAKSWLFLYSEINFFLYNFICFQIFQFSAMKCIALIREKKLWKCKIINLLQIFAFWNLRVTWFFGSISCYNDMDNFAHVPLEKEDMICKFTSINLETHFTAFSSSLFTSQPVSPLYLCSDFLSAWI